ncbi:MAG: DNA replication and repair protein RecF [Chitinophagales bacterium]|nr:DNA replication and repair protein RecF [Chitinophagales bacterium]
MYLRSLKLINYKNYRQSEAHFKKPFVLINGDNGSGKTNLIDAVYYLCICKSYFARQNNLLVRHGQDFFRLDGTFNTDADDIVITCKYQTDKKKEFLKNNAVYDRLSEHVGLIPVVMIAPDDIEIIHDGSEERRKFLDTAIAQSDRVYLQRLILYNKILMQRNALFRKMAEDGRRDHTLINALNHQLSEHGDFIYAERKKFVMTFTQTFTKMYQLLSDEKERPSVTYQSALAEQKHLQLLTDSLEKDIDAQRTTTGIHRDDLKFEIDQYPLKETGSQGQIKSFLIAMKLAQCSMITAATNKKPLLLLDDIFEKLDKKRLHILFKMLKGNDFSQVFITDADEKRSVNYFEESNVEYDHLQVKNGEIV